MPTQEQLRDLFTQFDTSGDGFIDMDELFQALSKGGKKVNAEEVEKILAQADRDADSKIDFAEFEAVFSMAPDAMPPVLKPLYEVGSSLLGGVLALGAATISLATTTADSIVGAVTPRFIAERAEKMQQSGLLQRSESKRMEHDKEEAETYATCINAKLASDESLSYLLPLKNGEALIPALADGVLMCKLVNAAAPEPVVPDKKIRLKARLKVMQAENHNLALGGMRKLGIATVNIGAEDLIEGKTDLVLGALFRLLYKVLTRQLSRASLQGKPLLTEILAPGQTLERLLALAPEDVLLQWINCVLAPRRAEGEVPLVTNYGADLKSGVVYVHLLSAVDPKSKTTTAVLKKKPEPMARMTYACAEARRMGVDFVPAAVLLLVGSEQFAAGFLAAIFNKCDGLERLRQRREAAEKAAAEKAAAEKAAAEKLAAQKAAAEKAAAEKVAAEAKKVGKLVLPKSDGPQKLQMRSFSSEVNEDTSWLGQGARLLRGASTTDK